MKANEEQKQQLALLLWKMGPGDINKLLSGGNPIPEKKTRATSESWKVMPMGDKTGTVRMNVSVSPEDMAILEMGHIPQVQEDHWFMYCENNSIRFYRSWTGTPVFFADYEKTGDGFVFTKLTVNIGDGGFGFGPKAAGDLFMTLTAAEIGADWMRHWKHFEESVIENK